MNNIPKRLAKTSKNLISSRLFLNQVLKMTDIYLIFTCPHDGRKKGSAANPSILKRDRSNLPGDICPVKDGEGFNLRDETYKREWKFKGNKLKK